MEKNEIPVGNTRAGELFIFFTGIILTAETEREHKETSFTANIKKYRRWGASKWEEHKKGGKGGGEYAANVF